MMYIEWAQYLELVIDVYVYYLYSNICGTVNFAKYWIIKVCHQEDVYPYTPLALFTRKCYSHTQPDIPHIIHQSYFDGTGQARSLRKWYTCFRTNIRISYAMEFSRLTSEGTLLRYSVICKYGYWITALHMPYALACAYFLIVYINL